MSTTVPTYVQTLRTSRDARETARDAYWASIEAANQSYDQYGPREHRVLRLEEAESDFWIAYNALTNPASSYSDRDFERVVTALAEYDRRHDEAGPAILQGPWGGPGGHGEDPDGDGPHLDSTDSDDLAAFAALLAAAREAAA